MGLPWSSHPSSTILDEISALSGSNVRYLVEEAPLEELVRTDNAQLATFALSAMISDALDFDADLAIGHSLGEYSALREAGILDLADATRLVVARGTAMAQASTEYPGSMVAVLGASDEALAHALRELPDVVLANENAPGQTVLAGSLPALEELRSRARELGLRKVIPLEVGGAFHSPLMAPALASLRAALEDTTFQPGTMPVIANVDAQSHPGTDDWVELLSSQLTSPVRFATSVANVPDEKASFIEIGPGGVLAGLLKRIRPQASVRSVGLPEDLASSEGAQP
jgi:[acyl-carrier-protein] S-malonyltransferase